MKLTKHERELAVESAAHTLHCCLSVAVKWKDGSPSHRSKAILTYVSKLVPELVGDSTAAEDVVRFVYESFASAKQAAKAAEEVAF